MQIHFETCYFGKSQDLNNWRCWKCVFQYSWNSTIRNFETLQLCNFETSKLWNFGALKLWNCEAQIWNSELNNALLGRLSMVNGSWLMAQGSWLMPQGSRLKAHGSWLMAKKSLALGPGAWVTQRQIFLGHEPWALRHEPRGMSHEPWAMRHEPLTIDNRLIDCFPISDSEFEHFELTTSDIKLPISKIKHWDSESVGTRRVRQVRFLRLWDFPRKECCPETDLLISWIMLMLNQSTEMKEPKSRTMVGEMSNNPRNHEIEVLGTSIHQSWIRLVPHEAE